MPAVIIPAHNEEHGLPRLLRALAPLDDLEVVVVANGCTDRTAAVAREHGVRVVETPVPSKIHALALGDRTVRTFPRLYVDADVVLGHADVAALCAALVDGVHAAGPLRVLPMDGVSPLVRGYYAIWQRLRGVRQELYGRGVIAVDERGHARLRDWPETMSDDLRIAMSFEPEERSVCARARVVIHPPRTYPDLLRRRVRAMTGNARLASGADAPTVRDSGASLGAVAGMVRSEPRLAPAAAVFVLTAAIARVRGRLALRRGDTTWLRDESSRVN